MKYFEIEFVFISETEKKGKESAKDEDIQKREKEADPKLETGDVIWIECIIQSI